MLGVSLCNQLYEEAVPWIKRGPLPLESLEFDRRLQLVCFELACKLFCIEESGEEEAVKTLTGLVVIVLSGRARISSNLKLSR